MKMYRQGDVLLIKCDDKPASDMKKVKRRNGKLILAEGEVTGHHHAVLSRHAALYESAVGMLLVLAKAAQLRHQEHSKIDLPTGSYKVVRQQEYTPRGWRDVQD